MVHRRCSNCGKDYYSADTRNWICRNCGEIIKQEDEVKKNDDREEN